MPHEIPRARGAIAGSCVVFPQTYTAALPYPGRSVLLPAVGLLLLALCAGDAREMNPGNLVSGSFTQGWGAMPPKPHERFAVFPNRKLGIMAMTALLFATPGYRNLTLQQAIHRYAPPTENSTARYYSHVLRAVGSNKVMASYTADEQLIIVNAMILEEGG